MIEIKERTKITAKIYGKEYHLTKPTVGQVEAFQKELKEKGEAVGFDLMASFAEKLGLPSQVIRDMEAEHFAQVMEVLAGVKKN